MKKPAIVSPESAFLADFGKLSRRRRQTLGIGLRTVAPVLGISVSTLSRIERGKPSTTTDFLKVARWLLSPLPPAAPGEGVE